MACSCIIPAITKFPFHRCRGEELCIVCGSHKDNEFWACPTCKPYKPKLDSDWKDGRNA